MKSVPIIRINLWHIKNDIRIFKFGLVFKNLLFSNCNDISINAETKLFNICSRKGKKGQK